MNNNMEIVIATTFPNYSPNQIGNKLVDVGNPFKKDHMLMPGNAIDFMNLAYLAYTTNNTELNPYYEKELDYCCLPSILNGTCDNPIQGFFDLDLANYGLKYTIFYQIAKSLKSSISAVNSFSLEDKGKIFINSGQKIEYLFDEIKNALSDSENTINSIVLNKENNLINSMLLETMKMEEILMSSTLPPNNNCCCDHNCNIDSNNPFYYQLIQLLNNINHNLQNPTFPPEFATEKEVSQMLSSALAKYVTSDQMNFQLANYLLRSEFETRMTAYTTKAEVQAEFATKEQLMNYYTKLEISSIVDKFVLKTDVYNKTEIDNKLTELIRNFDNTISNTITGIYNSLNTKLDSSVIANYYDKTTVDGKLNEKANVSDVYNKTEIDDKLAVKADTTTLDAKLDKTEAESTYATIESLNAKLDSSAIENYYDKTTVDGKLNEKANVSDVYNKTEIDDKLSQIQAGEGADLSGYAKTADVEANYVKKVDAESTYATKTEIESFITESTVDEKITNSENKINLLLENKLDTTTANETYATKTEIPVIDGLATKTEVEETYATKVEVATKANVSDVYNKTEIDDKLSQIQAGEGADLTNYYTKVETDGKLDAKLDKTEAESTYATKTELLAKADASALDAKLDSSVIANYYDKTTVDGKLDAKLDKTEAQSTYATIESLNAKLDSSAIENYYDKTTVDGKLDAKLDKTEAESTYATKTEITDFITSTTANENYVSKTVYDAKVQELTTKITALEESKTQLESQLQSLTERVQTLEGAGAAG